MLHDNDGRWLAAAARLAEHGRPLSLPNPAVGAMLVRNGKVVGHGWTQPGGRPHAEAAALEQAGEEAKNATLYVTLEPCAHHSGRGPNCAQLLVDAGVRRVVYAMLDPDPRTAGRGIIRLQAAGIAAEHVPCAAAEAGLAGYVARHKRGRPFVTLKLAMSLDGQIALPDGQSQWITGSPARAHVHAQRARQDVILVGGKSWRHDRPRLDVRLPGLENRSPRRMVLTREEAPDGRAVLREPEAIFAMEEQYLYIEGGAETAAAFLRADLVDRLDLYRAPILVGAGRSAVGDLGITELARTHGLWRQVERRQLGSDLYEAYERTR
ncbi:bifunctional diaminohydroxyphosphoribosylaminopyrimidine deaminase/5-amino-6-(5-phosphoribosylamino)uracil reductase RibD [Porphyrobacter sp. GA68]|uniref:bifunctional diaminohydroxyphosphoribosylaminopyrimidine deaminase/5-amino-6-(5-phosphoribosylamino)uracil reductase RibD n=1 Tax=Porphyrobacter sp. GA68 TaxID=2883480 RepID=UPI001D18A521|nr:bifunctional diaminohydroxyphosphoribosylaminopyrimidine deaminase/5-amino-6-(5-phosphoribosylamino)uracil reductase RibD [Porphyrobacter sp. GA68]